MRPTDEAPPSTRVEARGLQFVATPHATRRGARPAAGPSSRPLVLILAGVLRHRRDPRHPRARPCASATPVATPAARHPAQSVAPAFPASLTDDEGTAVTLAAAPQKIVSLTPATTETLFALGAGDRVVATDDGSDFPAEAVAAPRRRHLLVGRHREGRCRRRRPRHRRRARLHARPTPSPSCARSASRSWSSTPPSVDGVLQGHRARSGRPSASPTRRPSSPTRCEPT